LKRIFLITASVLLLLVLVAGGAALWLATQTIDVSRFAPRIAAEIETAVPGMRVTLGQISARREPLRGVVHVVISNSEISHRALAVPAQVDRLDVDLTLLPLLRGDVRVQSVNVQGLRAETYVSLTAIFKSDGSQPKRALPWAPHLKSVRLTDALLKLHDSDSGMDFEVRLPTLAAYQNLFGGDVRLAAQLALAHKSDVVPIKLKATATPDGPWHGDMRTDVNGALNIARAYWPKLDLPTAVPATTLTANLHQSDKLSADIALDVRAGAMRWPKYYAKPILLKRFTTQAKWRENNPRLNVSNFSMLIDQFDLHGAGTVDLANIDKSSAKLRFAKLSPQQLIALWPHNLASGGRRWIDDNIKSGEIRDGIIELASGGKLNFGFKMHDLLVTYRTPMPPLEHAFGQGLLTEKGLTLDLVQGSINSLNVVPARVVIENWSASPNMIRVDMPMTGDLPKLLAVLDSQPLGFISRYGVVPESTKGFIDGKLFLRFPLINALRTEEIEIKAKATSRSAMVPDVYAGRALNQAELDFDISSNGMLATGKGLIGPQPISLRWNEDFTGTKAAPSRYEIKAQSSVAILAMLDIDITTLASGTLDAAIDLDMKGPKMIRGQFTADARGAAFDMPLFGRVKAPGVPAQVSGNMRQQGQQLVIDALTVTSAPITLRGEARVPLTVGRSQFEIGQFTFGRNRLSGAVSFGNGGPVSLQIYGGIFDAKPMLKDFSRATVQQSTASKLRTEISAKLDAVEMLGDINLKNLNAQVTVVGDTLTRLVASGKLSGVAETRADVATVGASRVLTLNSSDAGQMGRALGVFKPGQGGALELVTEIHGSNGSLAINGHGKVRNMRIIDTPVMARMLTLASLTGLRDMATGRGILFETVDVPFKLQRGIIDVKNARAIGPGLGLTLEGQVLQSFTSLNLRGVIIPSYTLNAAIGKIPVIGTVLTGGKDQGLVGFNYRITGSAAKPLVDVQTSSGLALGPLRRLFQGKAAKVEPETKPVQY
jgi:Protein of unknown function/AsmA-like C-terminal region